MKRLILIIIIVLLTYAGYSYAGTDDRSDRLSNGQSVIFSPGYINAAKQKTENIINQSSVPKSLMENMAEYVKNKLGNKVNEDAADKPVPELKKKTSAVGEAAKVQNVSTTDIINSTQGDIEIGSGTNQYREGDRLIAEDIGGKRYVYAGFNDVGKSTIQDAINFAGAGDTVVVKAGTYKATVIVKDGVNLYGGFNESGQRDFDNTPTTIHGGFSVTGIKKTTQIDGFTIYGLAKETSYYGIFVSGTNFDNYLTVSNNNFAYGNGILVKLGSRVDISDNKFNGKGLAIYAPGFTGSYSYRPLPSRINSYNNDFASPYYNYSIYTTGKYVYITSTKDYFLQGLKASSGITVSNSSLAPIAQATSSKITENVTSMKTTQYELNPFKDSIHNNEFYSSENILLKALLGKDLDARTFSNIFKALLKSNSAGELEQESMANGRAKVMNIPGDVLMNIMLANNIEISDTEGGRMEAALKLANIIKDPTEDQKLLLNVAESIMKIEQESQSPELKKASDDLLQMVAAVLIAQAVPDLLKEGDMTNIKSIFSELNTQKNRIMLEYQGSVRPYYNEIVKELSKNMNILQLKNIISGNMVKEELEKLPPIELDKILKKLRNAKDRPSEEEHILQQEERYRKQYIDPNKKILEDKMKDMMKDFTQRLSGVLEGAKKPEKK